MKNNSKKIKKQPLLYGILFTFSIIFCLVGLYILLAPRWTQVAYSNIDWENFEGIYEYPKQGLFTLDYVLIIIFVLLASISVLYIVFIKIVGKGGSPPLILKIFVLFSLIITFSAGGATTVLGIPELEFYAYDAGPYLTWGSFDDGTQDPSSAITVCWHSKFLTNSKVHYGVNPDDLNQIASTSEFGRFHKVPISGLLANTTYYYQVSGFELKEFTTAPQGTFDYSFCVWADPRTNNGYGSAIDEFNIPEIMAQHFAIDDKEMEFSICAGDITSRGVDYKTWKLWLEDITTDDFASNQSHVVAIGNHERHDDTGAVNFPNYYPYADKDDIHFSYSYNYGNVHFSILDRWNTSDPWYSGDGFAQAEWLEQDLLANAERDFKILVMHNNPVLGDEHSGDCSLIMDVAKNNDVDVIFCGHWHTYETRDFDGGLISEGEVDEVCMMIGIGGNHDTLGQNGYCRIDVNSTSLRLLPRMADESTHFEEFIIQAN